MAVFWISFRIAKRTVGGRTYDQRYDALEEEITGMATMHWKETTSFIVFQTTNSLDAVAQKVKRCIAPSADLFLIRNMERKDAVICGQNDDDNIYDLMVDNDGKSYLRDA